MWKRRRVLPDGAHCEVCGQPDRNLLRRIPLWQDKKPRSTVLCRNHAAPLELVALPREEMPLSKAELLAYWAKRRPRILWLSRERRTQLDRRQMARFGKTERRRMAR